MADNKLELVVTVEVDKANQSIKSVNTSLSSMEASATKSAKGASQGIAGMTTAMVKGATAGSLFADAIKSALAWGKEFTVGSVMMAAENAKAEASLKALATAHGVGAAAASKQVASIEEVGFEFTEAAHAVQRLIVADMDLAKPRVSPSSPRTRRRFRTCRLARRWRPLSSPSSRARRAAYGRWPYSSTSRRRPRLRSFNWAVH